MAIPSRFTKVKIAAGYTLLLVVLLLSLLFVHREMEKLSDTDDVQSLQTDSLLLLLKEKDENTIRMLQIINEANESMITPVELDSIIAEQDTVITQQRVQHRIITKRDSVITKRKKKGFFRRLGEVFAPSKEDTAVLVNTAVEFATDTILEPYNPIDSLHQRIRTVTKRKSRPVVRPNYNARLRRMNKELTTRIDSMITTYEQVVTQRAMDNASEQQGHKFVYNGKPQSKAFLTLRSRQPGEFLKYLFTVTGCHTFTSVHHLDADTGRMIGNIQCNATLSCEFHSIGKQIIYNLPDTERITDEASVQFGVYTAT